MFAGIFHKPKSTKDMGTTDGFCDRLLVMK